MDNITWTDREKLDLKEQEVDLLKQALQDVVKEKEFHKNNYLLVKAQFLALEAYNKWLLWGVRGN